MYENQFNVKFTITMKLILYFERKLFEKKRRKIQLLLFALYYYENSPHTLSRLHLSIPSQMSKGCAWSTCLEIFSNSFLMLLLNIGYSWSKNFGLNIVAIVRRWFFHISTEDHNNILKYCIWGIAETVEYNLINHSL